VATEYRKAERGSRHVPPGEGSKSLWVFGELVTYKVTSVQTGGVYSLFEVATHPGGGPSPHVQHREDESFYVLEGEYEFLDDDGRIVRAGPGSLFYVPRGNLHSYKNVGERYGRALICQTPGGLHESFFEEIGEPATNRSRSPATAVLSDIGRIVEVAANYGIEIPPLRERHTGEDDAERSRRDERIEVPSHWGTGLLGSRVVDRLGEAREDVRVMSRSRRADTVWGDLLIGEGLDEAVEGVSTIMHCASSPFRKTGQVDVKGTRRLLQAASRSGVSHVVFISIVGVDRNPYYPYFRHKLDAEQVVERSGLPWTTLRATQFHEFVLKQLLELGPVALVPKEFLLQPIETGEVANRLVELALSAPAGRVPDVGGPEVRTFANLACSYQEAAGRHRRLVEVPVPGKVARAFREGAQTCPERRYGTITWEEFPHRARRRTVP